MTAKPIIFVRTDGHDIQGDGSHQHPFRTVSRARSDYPDAFICIDEVFSTVPPRQLTEVGEEADATDLPPVPVRSIRPNEGGNIIAAALICGFLAGFAFSAVAGMLVGCLVVVLLVLVDMRAAR